MTDTGRGTDRTIGNTTLHTLSHSLTHTPINLKEDGVGLPLIPTLGKQQVGRSQAFEASLVYIGSSRPVRAT